MALMALMAYGLWQDQCDYYGYPVKEHKKTNAKKTMCKVSIRHKDKTEK